MSIRKPVLLAMLSVLLVSCGKQQTGGGGIFGDSGPKTISSFNADWDTGRFSHDLLLRNDTESDLKEVDLSISLFRTDGQTPIVKRFWSNWSAGEVKKINFPSHPYQMVKLDGKAYQNSKSVKISNGWTWEWGRKN
jgi:hypothetical protein